jgi:hypothetical protein
LGDESAELEVSPKTNDFHENNPNKSSKMKLFTLLATTTVLSFFSAAGQGRAATDSKPLITWPTRPGAGDTPAEKVKFNQAMAKAITENTSLLIDRACKDLGEGKKKTETVLETLKDKAGGYLKLSGGYLKSSKDFLVERRMMIKSFETKIAENPSRRKRYKDTIQKMRNHEEILDGLIRNDFSVLMDKHQDFLKKSEEWKVLVQDILREAGEKGAANELRKTLLDYRETYFPEPEPEKK